MEFVCNNNYLVLPINNKAKMKKIKFFIDNKLVLDYDARIDYVNPSYYTYCNLKRFKGENIVCKTEPKINLIPNFADDEFACTNYNEPFRPKLHYSVSVGFSNDVNGLFYNDGLYHMFVQHNPFGHECLNPFWGHCISDDLVHWKQLPSALEPDEHGSIWSGSAIVDKRNTLGLNNDSSNAVVLFYTSSGGFFYNHTGTKLELSENIEMSQCMAYSTDNGMTFTKYENNPLIENITNENRDPLVIYSDELNKYIMIVCMDDVNFKVFESENLTDWKLHKNIVINEESACPDLFCLECDGEKQWFFSAGRSYYLKCGFENGEFEIQSKAKKLVYGNNFVCAQTWKNEPKGRVVRVAWNSFEIPGNGFNKAVTFPVELTMVKKNDDYIICHNPVSEIKLLYQNTKVLSDIKGGFTCDLENSAYDITLNLDILKNTEISVFEMKVLINKSDNKIVCCDAEVPYEDINKIKLRMLIDSNGIELFINDGELYAVGGDVADYNINRMEISDCIINEIEINKLKSIWEK